MRLRAHPRSRGENVIRMPERVRDAGSSPLTRGKPRPSCGDVSALRLIPAHAGKTRARARGFGCWCGSSPLTRGKRLRRGGRRDSAGLIPAHAGKTATAALYAAVTSAHPRSRGENYISLRLNGHRGGSSPLTRGKPQTTAPAPQKRRLIPAHAGKTASFTGRPASSWAHPRSRGENIKTGRTRF